MSLGLWALCGFLATLVYKRFIEKNVLTYILYMRGIPQEKMSATGGLVEETVSALEKSKGGRRFFFLADLFSVVILLFIWPVVASFSVFSLLYVIVMPSPRG